MTQEEKAKAYDEALENARQEYNTTENVERKQWLEELFPELAEIKDEKVRKFLLKLAYRCPEDSIGFRGEVKKEDVIAWLEKQAEQKPSDYNHLAELAEGEVTTSNGISENMMSLRIEHTPLSTRAKNLLRYQFNTIGDLVSYCDGKWRRLRALRNIGNVTYNEIMEYLGIDDRL